MTQEVKKRVKILGEHFKEKKARKELQAIINSWLQEKKEENNC